MFDNLRKSGSSMIVWVLFGILIAGFVISFGPQSVGSSQGCQSGGRVTVMNFGGTNVDDAAWRFAYGLARGAEVERGREMAALSQLVRRELLAAEAERRGLRVSDSLIDHVITAGELHYGGRVIPAKGAFYDEEGKGVFNYEQFKRFVFQRMNMSVAGYKRQQNREILASTMDRILRGSVAVSVEEARARYVADNTTVAFDAVRFDPADYADALRITDADLDRYALAHEAEVKATYVEATWKGKKQLRVRRVYVGKVGTPPPPAPIPGAPTTPPPAPIDPALTKLEAARADIVAGRKTFAAVAAALDADPIMRSKSGDWGWYDEAAMTLPEPTLNDAVKALTEAAPVSKVIEAGDGFYLVTVSERRSGDLTFEQVKRDLADKLARPAWGQEAAKRGALLALEMARTTGKGLKDLFPSEQTGAGAWSSSYDVPTAWMQAGGGSGSAAAGAPATPTPTPTTPTTPAATPVAASAETLPTLGEVKPKVDSFPPLARFGNRTMVGESADLTKAVYEELTAGALGPKVYEVKTGAIGAAPVYVIVQVGTKNLADVAAFEKDAAKFVAELASARGDAYVTDWLRHRCKGMVAKNEVRPRRDLLTTADAAGNVTTVPWDPCASL